jgi:chromosome segregation ATPase
MTLLIVTGISHSNWQYVAGAMQIPFTSVASEVQATLNNVANTASAKNVTDTVSNIVKNIEQDKPQIALVPNCAAHLNELLKIDSLKVLVFYNDPEYSLAQALSEKSLSTEEALASSQQWKQQLDSAFAAYRKHKQNCLLLNGQDVLGHNTQSQTAIAEFCEAEVKINKNVASVASDKLLAAKLLLQEQDDLFDFYDEIKSDAPLFGEFTVSGITSNTELCAMAMGALQEHQTLRNKTNKEIKEHASRFESINAEHQQTSKQLAQTKNELESKQAALTAKEQQIQQLQKQNGELTAKVPEIEQQKEGLRSQVAKLSEEQNQKTQQLTQAQQELESKQAALTANEQQVQQLQKHNGELSAKVPELEQQRDGLKSQVAKLSEEQNQKTQQLTKSQQELESKQAALSTKEQQIQQLQKHNGELSAKVPELEQQREGLKSQVAKLSEDQNQKSQQLTKSQQELESKQAALTAKEQQVQQLQKQNGELTAKVPELEQQKEGLKSQVAKLSEEQNQKTRQLTKSQQELESKQAALSTKEQQIQQLQKHNAELSAKVPELEQQREGLKSQVAKLSEEQEQKTQQLTQAQKELESKQAELSAKEQQIKQLNQELTKLNDQCVVLNNDIEAKNNQLTQSTQKITHLEQGLDEAGSEAELQLLQIAQLQEELETTYSNMQTSEAKAKELETQLSEQTKASAAIEKDLKQELVKIKQESLAEEELQLLQIVQLQEELETTYSNMQTSEAKAKELETQLSEQTKASAAIEKDLKQELVKIKQESLAEEELQLLQIVQLQEELETTHTTIQNSNQRVQVLEQQQNEQTKTFSATENTLKEHVAQLNNQITTLKEEMRVLESQSDLAKEQQTRLQQSLEQAESDTELAMLQVAQMQEELETNYLALTQAQEKLSSQQNSEKQIVLIKQQAQELEAENELAVLQINQLQEELEYYFQQLQQKESAHMSQNGAGNKPIHKVYEKGTIGQATIIGGYSADGYRDIQLLLEKVVLADGRVFESVLCKLLEVEGRPGIEFRPAENSIDLQWNDEMVDDYGHYITYLPNPPASKVQMQNSVDESLCASDRVAVLSIASMLNDILQLESLAINKEMQEGELRDWRLAAIELKQQIAVLPAWMSFDQLGLVEEMRDDNYEHLWFTFNNLLLNDQLFPEFEVKFAAFGQATDKTFATKLLLELRELPSGFGPLQAWPPISKDDYGYKFNVTVDLSSEQLLIKAVDKTSLRDKQLVRHLLKNLINFIQVNNQQGTTLSRDLNDWLAVGRVLQNVGVFESDAQDEVQSDLQGDVPVKIATQATSGLQFRLAEFIDLGGYQHLVFEHNLQDEQSLKLKIRANHIDNEEQEVSLAIELRTGDDSVPFAQSNYFAEDEYGPRVLFLLSEAEDLIFDETFDNEQRILLSQFVEALPVLIESSPEIDENSLKNWLTWLSTK